MRVGTLKRTAAKALRTDRPPWLDIRLSSYEFRTYRKRSGHISLRHRSYLMVPTNTGFSLSAYLSRIAAYLTLPDATEIQLDHIAYTEVQEFKYDGETMVHLLWLSHVVPRTEVKPGLGHLRIEYQFQFVKGCPDARAHEHPAIIKPMPYYRAAS